MNSNFFALLPEHLWAELPLRYKWTERLALSIDGYANPKLYDAINLSSYRLKMALGSLLAELIVRRLSPFCDTKDAIDRVNASWTAVVDTRYITTLEIDYAKGAGYNNREPVLGVLLNCLLLLEYLYLCSKQSDIYIASNVCKLAWLAKHIAINKKEFESWLSQTLARSAKVFPRNAEYDQETEEYDYSHEIPVSPFFFSPDQDFQPDTNAEQINNFLSSLNPDKNAYLKSPEDMLSEGFMGTPYQFKV